MSSSIKTVALYGADNALGQCFAKILSNEQNQDLQVTLLTTTEPESSDLVSFTKDMPSVVNVRQITIGNQDEIVNILAGIDAVISTVSGTHLLTQLDLIKAAENAGVKVFVPANYGPDFNAPANQKRKSLFATGHQIQTALQQSSLNYINVCSGFFADYYLTPLFDWDISVPSVVIYSGSTKASFTAMDDLAKYTVSAVRRYQEFKNHTLRIASYSLSPDDWIEIVERITGKKIQVVQKSLDELVQIVDKVVDLPKDLEGTKLQMAAVLATGGGQVDWGTHELDNNKFPEIKPAPISEFVKKVFQ
ncbi:hypothetical protein H4R99_002323 [Coemansia sp. RSA 1722]|nr:hypothetical protein H4R99_002323 [Coemansia sp. RSA 1722]